MRTYEERIKRAFDIGAIIRAYLGNGLLTEGVFDRVFENTIRIRALHIEGLDWLLFDHLLSVCQHIPLATHLEALSAGIRRPFAGTEAFCKTLIEIELMPPCVLNHTRFFRPPQPGRLIGEMLVEAGLISAKTLKRSLGIREVIRETTADDVSIGHVLRSVGGLSIVDFFQVLGIQLGIPYVNLDESAPRIYEAAARRTLGRATGATDIGRPPRAVLAYPSVFTRR